MAVSQLYERLTSSSAMASAHDVGAYSFEHIDIRAVAATVTDKGCEHRKGTAPYIKNPLRHPKLCSFHR